MITEIQTIIDKYTSWLKDKTVLREVEDWVEITTPYVDRHNDYIQIYAKKENGKFVLTDDRYTIEDLRMCGCEINKPKRKKMLEITLNRFGVMKDENDSLYLTTMVDDFPQKKHRLVQAILAVNDLFFTSSAHVQNLFFEDVSAWLDLHDIRYTTNINLPGKTKFDHSFDFIIPKSKKSPERILKTMTQPTKDKVQSLLFSWLDTKEARPDHSKAYAIINDTDKNVPPGILDALSSYDMKGVPWSQRESVVDELAA